MLNPGQILDGKYEIIKVLGRGGMGTVYLSKNSRLGNLWAIKEISSQWKNQVDFLTEPNILRNLKHTGIIRIIDIFFEDKNLYIVEDYIEGKTLKEYVEANGKLSSELVKDVSLQLCYILDYLHSLNPPIVYRDLKPSNIMITPYNKVILIDFGIARVYKEGQEGDTAILGSVGYIAQEQLTKNQSNAKTDIYSLGATMFFMVTGKSIRLSTELMFEENYPKHIPKSLVKVIQKASAIDPGKRYNNVKMMISELKDILLHREYDKTILMNSQDSSAKPAKTFFMKDKRNSMKFKLVMISLLTFVVAFSFLLIWFSSNNIPDKKAVEAPTVQKTSEQIIPEETKVSEKSAPVEVIKKVDERVSQAQKELEEKLREDLKKAEEKERKESKKGEEKSKGNNKYKTE
jgi:serine/threonine protein kinase